ncbi:MAG: thioredoxin family protein [Limnohabitans sp.]|nr:thioredoxin family protein [Limnohabitans sp.]
MSIFLGQTLQAQDHKHEHKHSAGPTQSAPARTLSSTQAFNEKSWDQLLKNGPRPAAYLFTTTYCSTCPAAFEVLHQAVKEKGRPVPLMAVMMDASGAKALRHASHFKGMTKMYAFEGFEPEIRQSVDSAWPNVTPYVVMIDAKGNLQKVIGPPSPEMLRRWLP